MDFKEKIKTLGKRVISQKDKVNTEEATKTAFVLPFIQELGYDIFNPDEVMPEFTADIGTKKGEKVDYAILSNEKPIIIIECKHLKEKLDVHTTQLYRYFHVTEAKFAVLTNGLIYHFYTDLVAPNKMDEKPFLEINIADFNEIQINELARFQKSKFDSTEILAEIRANKINLNHTNQLTEIIKNELNQPSDGFVNFFIRKLPIDTVDAKVIEKFSPILKEILQKVINEMAVFPIQNDVKAVSEQVSKSKLTDYSNDENIAVENDTIQSTKTLLKVTFLDKTVICENNVSKTYVKTLQLIGLDMVKALDIIISGVPLIDNKKNDKYQQQQLSPEIFIMVNISTKDKIRFLQKISDKLNLGLIIEKTDTQLPKLLF